MGSYNGISGKWIGFYIQNQKRYAFEMTLNFEGEKIKGEGEDEIGKFSFNGTLNFCTGTIQIVKQYYGKHTVSYNGNLSRDGRTIDGTYDVPCGDSDSYMMSWMK